MEEDLLLGDEAVAISAIHSGIAGSYAYPGTPATEIHEYVRRYVKQHNLNIHINWSANEKVAYEEALGVSYAGKRALVSMKHVGLNVAADPFMNSAETGANGGLVLVVADDPGMKSSQNEQDSRYYADFALVFAFEPSNQQEAYDMTRDAFLLSEQLETPVMIKMVTTLAHSRSKIKFQEPLPQPPLKPATDWRQWTILPVNARVQFKKLLEKQKKFIEYSENSRYNELYINEDNKSLGVITSGVGFNYFKECKESQNISFLKIGTYPLPVTKIKRLYSHVEKILLIEEGYPFIERKLGGVLGNEKIIGKLTGHIPITGELTPDSVEKALTGKTKKGKEINFTPPPRPPALCRGCPHGDLFKALNDAMKDYPEGRVFSDIGCYTLGALPPYNSLVTCVDMGASVSMSKGAADVGLKGSVAVIGDSTFAHSGMTPLLGAAIENSNMTVIILDNGAVAMTGGQETMATGEGLVNIIKGLGVKEEHIRTIIPLPKNHEENVKILKEELSYNGTSVIISKRDCIQIKKKN